MPIKGLVRGIANPLRIEKMEVGETAYMYFDEVFLSQDILYVHAFTQVINQSNFDTLEKFLKEKYITIKRLGMGFTDKDFELDFSSLAPDFFLSIESPIPLKNMPVDERSQYLFFHDFDLGIAEIEVVSPLGASDELNEHTPLNVLEEKLVEAEDSQDYETASKIRDFIAKQKEK